MSEILKTEEQIKQEIVDAAASQVSESIKSENLEIKSAINQLAENTKMLSESNKSIAELQKSTTELLEKQSKKEAKSFMAPIGEAMPINNPMYAEYIEKRKSNPEAILSVNNLIDKYKETKAQPTVNAFRYDYDANGGYLKPQAQLMPIYNDTINSSLDSLPLYMDIAQNVDPMQTKKQIIYDQDFRTSLPDSANFDDAVAEATRLSFRTVDLSLTETRVFQVYPTITKAEDIRMIEATMLKAWSYKIARSFVSESNVNDNLHSIIPNIVSNNRFIETNSNANVKFDDIETLALQLDSTTVRDSDMYLVISSVAKKDLYNELGTDGQYKNRDKIFDDANGFARIRTSRGDIKLIETDIQDDVMGVNTTTKKLTNGSIIAALVNFKKTFLVEVSPYEILQLDRAKSLLQGSSVSIMSAWSGSRIRTEKHSFGLKFKV